MSTLERFVAEFRVLGLRLRHLMRNTHLTSHRRNEAGLVRIPGGASGAGVAERVARGAALLDKQAPGWHRNIVRQVRIQSVVDCALGQTYGHYSHGLRNLGLTDMMADDYGFRANVMGWNVEAWADYQMLNAEWARVLVRRHVEDGRKGLG